LTTRHFNLGRKKFDSVKSGSAKLGGTRPTYRFLRCLCLLSALSPVTTVFADEFTFSQAWQLLQQNNDGLAASKANKEEAVFLKEAAENLYAPNIDITGAYTRLDDDITLAPSQLFNSMPAGDTLNSIFAGLGNAAGIPPGDLDKAFTSEIARQDVVTASLNAVWPIYTGGRITAAQDIAVGQVLEADHLLRIKRQALFERLTKYYFGVVLAKQVLETRENAEKGLYKHLDHAKKLEQQGQIARVERLKAEASFTKAQVERRKAQRNMDIAQMALNRLLQEKFNITPGNKLFVNDDMPELASIVTDTLNNHPGLGVLDAKRLQAQGLVDVKEGEYWPEAFLFGNYRLYQQDTLADELIPDWLVGVGVKIPLSSRSGRSGKLKAARSTLSKIDLLKAQAVRDLGLLVEQTWREAQTAREEYNGLATSLELAHENIRMRVEAFTQGLSTSLEVVDAELFLVSVQTQQQAAAYRYVLSLARLLALSNQMAEFTVYQANGRQANDRQTKGRQTKGHNGQANENNE
jgi:outer membrane protein TolC